MKYRDCPECGRLFTVYLDTVKVWTKANKELVESALADETVRLSGPVLDKCRASLENCKAAEQELRKHIQAAHGTIVH